MLVKFSQTTPDYVSNFTKDNYLQDQQSINISVCMTE